MAEKRMSCWMCPRYDRTERHCKDGKRNPKRKAETREVAEMLGFQSICHYNPYRDEMAIRMYFPDSPMAKTKRSRSRRRGGVSVTEILDILEEKPGSEPPTNP